MEFGEKRFYNWLKKDHKGDTESTVKSLEKELIKFNGLTDLDDDVTIVAIRCAF